MIHALLAGPIEKGKAPDFNITGFDGREFTLSEHPGHVVIVNFWASRCPPCREEASYLATGAGQELRGSPSDEATFDELIAEITLPDESYQERRLTDEEYQEQRQELMQKAKPLSEIDVMK